MPCILLIHSFQPVSNFITNAKCALNGQKVQENNYDNCCLLNLTSNT